MREPSVTTLSLGVPSRVSWLILTTRGGGDGRLSHTSTAEAERRITANEMRTRLNLRSGEFSIVLAALFARDDKVPMSVVEGGALRHRHLIVTSKQRRQHY